MGETELREHVEKIFKTYAERLEISKNMLDSLPFTEDEKKSLLNYTIPKGLEMTEDRYLDIMCFIEAIQNETSTLIYSIDDIIWGIKNHRGIPSLNRYERRDRTTEIIDSLPFSDKQKECLSKGIIPEGLEITEEQHTNLLRYFEANLKKYGKDARWNKHGKIRMRDDACSNVIIYYIPLLNGLVFYGVAPALLGNHPENRVLKQNHIFLISRRFLPVAQLCLIGHSIVKKYDHGYGD